MLIKKDIDPHTHSRLMKLHCRALPEARFNPFWADECEPPESVLNLGLTSEAIRFAEPVFSCRGSHRPSPSPLPTACLGKEVAGFPRNPSELL
jgi:hypothetical protein